LNWEREEEHDGVAPAILQRLNKAVNKAVNDKTERAFEEVRQWKNQKRKGEITLMFDGSGTVSKIKVVNFIQ